MSEPKSLDEIKVVRASLLPKESPRHTIDELPTLDREGINFVILIYLNMAIFEVIGSLPEPFFKRAAEKCHPDNPTAGADLLANIWMFRYLVCLMATPIICSLSDKLGRKPIIIFCIAMRCACVWIFEFCNGNPWMLYFKMFVYGFSPNDGVYIAFITDRVPKPLWVRYICWFSAAASVGIYGGLPIGQMLQDENGEVQYMGWTGTILSVVTLYLLWLIPDEAPPSNEERESRASRRSQASMNSNASQGQSSTNWALILVLVARLCHRIDQVQENVFRQNVYQHNYPDHFMFSTHDGGKVNDTRYGYLCYGMGATRACTEVLTGIFVTNHEKLWNAGACVVMAACGLVSSAGFGEWLSMIATSIFHCMIGIGLPMFFAIVSKSGDQKSQGKLQGIAGVAKEIASAATPKLIMFLWSFSATSREKGTWWGGMLPDLIGSVSVLSAAVCLFVSWKIAKPKLL